VADSDAAYRAYHARRYATLLDVVRTQLAGVEAPRILDVGPNAQTELLRRETTAAVVDTLGYEHPHYTGGGRHVEVDLDATDADGIPQGDSSYDAVVMAEVIEHLHTAAPTVLRYLAGWLRPGGVLVLQTPNAVALHKRLRMLAGRNPYEPIRSTPRNPGHFHEYTLGELTDAAAAAGLVPSGRLTANYFGDSGTAAYRLYAALGPVLPESLRHGITMWLRRP
jgi:SAM-dependent methyltransferase